MRDEIIQECLNLDGGSTLRMVCPSCNAVHEKSLAVSRTDDGLLYHCFRAKCGASGIIPSNGYIPQHRDKPPPTTYIPTTRRLTEKESILLIDRYHFDNQSLQLNKVAYDDVKQRIAIPLFDKKSKQRGWYYKDEFGKGHHPDFHKRSDFFSDEYPRLYFPRTNKVAARSAIIVEDPLSAIALSSIMPAVSILGTRITDKEALQLQWYNHLYVWLDYDAVEKAIEIRNQFPTLNIIRIIITPNDPKDCDIAERIQAIR